MDYKELKRSIIINKLLKKNDLYEDLDNFFKEIQSGEYDNNFYSSHRKQFTLYGNIMFTRTIFYWKDDIIISDFMFDKISEVFKNHDFKYEEEELYKILTEFIKEKL